MQRALTLLGFAQAAGKVVSGETGTRIALQKGKGRLLILAADASPATRDRFTALANHRGVRMVLLADRATLGRAIGKAPRATVVILDDHFAQVIVESLGLEEK